MGFDPSQPFEAVAAEESPAFNPLQPYEAVAVAEFDPGQPFEAVQIAEEKPSAPDTSFSSAIKQGIDAPLEAIGTTAQVFGATKIGKALKDLTEAPVNYESASERFGKPKEGDFTIAGFAPAQIPRALTEQFGQITGSLISRVAGGIIGGVITGGAGAAGGSAIPVAGTAAGGLGGLGTGAVVGQFAGPFLFGALQIAGPTALERAKRNGRTDPNGEDIAAALVTAAGSGSLDAIGAQYLPGGKKLVGSFVKRLAGAFYGETATESVQSVTEQTGESLGTKEGLKIDPKQAIAEGIIGGLGGSAATAISEPFRPADPALAAAAPATAKAVARTQPVTVTVPEVATPTLPSGSLGSPDPIVVEAEAAGAPQTAAALNQTMPPKPFAPRIEEPGTPTPYGRETDVFDVTAGLQRAPLSPAPESTIIPEQKPSAAGAPLPEPTRTEPSPQSLPAAAAVPEVAAPAAPEGDSAWLEALMNPEASAGQAPQTSPSFKPLKPIIDTLRYDLEKQAEDWDSRRYKPNKTQIELRGDGPGKRDSISIGSINEGRRQKALDAIGGQIRAIDKLSDAISTPEGETALDSAIKRTWDEAGKTFQNSRFKNQGDLFESLLIEDVLKLKPARGAYDSLPLSKAIRARMESEAKPVAAPAAPEPAPVASIKVGDTITAKSHQITGLTHTGKVVSVQGDEIGMVNQDNAPVLVLKKNVENTEPAPAPSRVQLRSGPATYSVVEQLAPQKGDQPGEVYFRVKNEQTGEEQTVEAGDMKPIKAKGAKVKAEPAQETTTNPFDTSETSRRLTELRDTKPRPINKYFGTSGGTTEQRANHEAKIRQWNNDYKKAQKAHKEAVEKSNAWIAEQAVGMKKKLRGSESGAIPASLFADIADFGARIYRDGMSFARWSADMVRHLGERVRSALKELWVGILNPKGARNLRGEVIQKRDQGGAIGAAGGRAEPKPGATVEGGREGEYYTRVAERDKGTLSDNAWNVVRNRTTLPDSFKEDVDEAAKILLQTNDGDLRSALDRSKEMSASGLKDYFSGLTDRRKAALLFLIAQNAATQRETATDPKQIAALKDVEAEAIADFSDLMSQGGKLLNIAGQLYAAMPMSPDAQVMAAEKLLARMTGGKAAEAEAAQAKDTLKTALDEQLKGMDESIRDIMRTKPKASWDEIRQRIADEVVAKMDLATEVERKAATNKIIADLKKRMEKVRKELLAKMSKPGKPGNKTALDKLWKLWELGALDDDALTKVFMEKAGVKEFTPAFRDKLRKMYEDAETAPEGMPRERILGNIAVELALANPKTFGFWWNLAMSISYGNILGAFTTIFVNNPLGSAATAGEMTLMSALSNKGARAETLKGAVKTWARSFGDGVAMMRDLWSTGENLQKVSQFDSALVNSPVELLAKMAEDPAFPKKFRGAAKAVSQYKWIMRAMMAADAVIRWPAREAARFTQAAALAKETRRPGQSLEDAVDELNYPGGRQAAVRESRAQAAQERKDGTLKTKLDERLRVIQLLQSKLSSEGTEAATESDELANYGSLLNDQPQDFIGVIASAILKIAFPSNTKTDIQKALGGAAQPFVRFVRTSANATRVMLDYSIGYGAFRYMTRNWPVIGAESLAGGANLIQPEDRHKMSKEAAIRAGDRLTQVRIQRAYLGIALYAGLAAIYAAIDDDDEDPYIDFIGSGPTTPDERRRLRDTKRMRFNSIKIGDIYVPTNVGPLQPLAGILAPFQRMRDNKKWPKAKDEFDEKVPEMAGVAVARGIADAIMNQSFTRSLADLLTMLNTGKTSFGETPTEFIGKNLAQFIPGNLRGLSQLDEIVSGKKERADGFFDTAANSIAFYAPNGRAVTILGDEVDAGKPVVQRVGEKVFQFTTMTDDKTALFVARNGLSIPDRQRKADGKRQTYPEYSAYMRESGKMMRNWLETKNPETGKTGMEMLQSIPDEAPGKNGRPTNPRRKAMNDLWVKFRRVALMKQ